MVRKIGHFKYLMVILERWLFLVTDRNLYYINNYYIIILDKKFITRNRLSVLRAGYLTLWGKRKNI